MPPQLQRRLGAMATVAALAIAGCGSSDVQGSAAAFLDQHRAGAVRAAETTKAVEADVSRLSRAPGSAQLERLARAAAQAHRSVVQAGEWSVAEPGEEEDLPRAETEVTEAANELSSAMSAALAYTRTPSTAALERYEGELARGREKWDEGISQLWYLANRSNPPTV